MVSNIFYFHPDPWGNDPVWRAYFSDGWFNHQLDKHNHGHKIETVPGINGTSMGSILTTQHLFYCCNTSWLRYKDTNTALECCRCVGFSQRYPSSPVLVAVHLHSLETPLWNHSTGLRGKENIWKVWSIWANCNDLSRRHPKWWFNKGTSPKSP